METSKKLLLIMLFCLLATNCHAQFGGRRCPLSSCGSIANISYPLRLRSDPKHCGDPRYELSCEKNSTALYSGSVRFYVQAINYNNYTLRVVDADYQKDNCSSFPRYTNFDSNFSIRQEIKQKNNRFWLSKPIATRVVVLKCKEKVNSSHYIELTSYCSKEHRSSNSYYYLVYLNSMSASDMEISCSTEQKALLSPDSLINKTALPDFRNQLALGFELTWVPGNCYTVDFNGIQCRSIFMTRFQRFFDETSRYLTYLFATSISVLYVSIFIAILYVIKFIFGTPFVVAFLVYKWRRRHRSTYNSIEEFLGSHNNLVPIRYSYADIKKMTQNFKTKLGQGGYGSVYKGKLRSNRLVAIKILSKSAKTNGQDFINEVATIGRIHHFNVVRLIGYCVEGSKHALVYDFMPNGALDSYIFHKSGYHSPLTGTELFDISLGVARGIEYLHRGCCMQILHFDIKPHNILLDENFTPKVSDFGLARLCPLEDDFLSLTAARGTLGYIAPELFYKNIGGVSSKADVYSFGMLLMEMGSQRKNLNAIAENSSQIYYPSWVYEQLSRGMNAVPVVEDDISEEDSERIKKMITVALWCIQLNPSDRPSMQRIIEMLESEGEDLPFPPKPSYCPQQDSFPEQDSDGSSALN